MKSAAHLMKDAYGLAGSSHVGRGTGVVLATTAVMAGAWYELGHRQLSEARLASSGASITRLAELQHDSTLLSLLDANLRREWGSFAFVGFDSVQEMAALAGDSVYVVLQSSDGATRPVAALQTIRTNTHGDPEVLSDSFASFESLTSAESWKRARSKGGDTAVLLQITVFESDERGGSLGSILRNAALHLQPSEVKFALTTTPIDLSSGAPPVVIGEPSTYSPAMKFHMRGGAKATKLLPRFKTSADVGNARHGEDVAVMRYTRGASGEWPMPRPAMQVTRQGPLEHSILNQARNLSRWSARQHQRLQIMEERLEGHSELPG